MKKLFAIVLVIAMALAIAVPAMATGWDPIVPDTTPSTAIGFKLYGLETEENTAVLGGLYEELKATYPLVKGTDVHFVVVVTVPAKSKLSAANINLLSVRGLTAKVATSNIYLTEVNTYVDGNQTDHDIAAFDAEITKISHTYYLSDIPDAGCTVKFEFWGKGVTGGKDGTVKASIGYYNSWDGVDDAHTFLAWNADGKLSFTAVADNNAYNAAKAQGDFTVYNGAVADTNDRIIFPVYNGMINDDNGPALVFTLGTDGKVAVADAYAVTRSTASNGGYIFRSIATPATAFGVTDTTGAYAELKAAFEAILAKLGFSYDGMNAMTKEHYVKYFGTIDEVTETLLYPAGYVTVTNPSVEPPQTGDATTVVGFVMIAIALIAAAAVTVKKVRA